MLLLYVSFFAAKINLLSITTTKHLYCYYLHQTSALHQLLNLENIGHNVVNWLLNLENIGNNGVVQMPSHKINNILLFYLSNYSWLIFFNVFFVFTMIIYLSYYSRSVVILTYPDKFNGVMMRDLLVFVESLSVSMT